MVKIPLQTPINRENMNSALKKFVAEVVHSMPDSLRICDRLSVYSVIIRNGSIVFPTGKRANPYSAQVFWEEFVNIQNSINNEIVESLIMNLQQDAVQYPFIHDAICQGKCSELVLQKMWVRYRMYFQRTKYKGIKFITSNVTPRTEFYSMPYCIDFAESFCHEFFNMNYQEYIGTLATMVNGGDIRQAYNQFKGAVLQSEADRMNARRKE